MKFKSKVAWQFHFICLVFVLFNLWGIVEWINAVNIGILVLIFTPLNVFIIIPIWLNTYYLLKDGELLVKCGLLSFKKIDCDSITKVTETRNPVSSPALSLDRLEITYKLRSGSTKHIIVSPKDKVGFIEELKAVNPGMEIPAGESGKKMGLVVNGILALVAVGIIVLFVVGEREPQIIVDEDAVRVRALYGTEINFADISDITLLEQSMRDFGAGMRTNGYGGFVWRGHFAAGLLFVSPNSTPIIRIERHGGSDVFISFRAGERTRDMYSELREILNRE